MKCIFQQHEEQAVVSDHDSGDRGPEEDWNEAEDLGAEVGEEADEEEDLAAGE